MLTTQQKITSAQMRHSQLTTRKEELKRELQKIDRDILQLDYNLQYLTELHKLEKETKEA